MGGKMFAPFNPARWSGSVTLDKGISQLQDADKRAKEDGNERAIGLKVPAGVFTPEQRFASTTEAIAHLANLADTAGADEKLEKLQAAQLDAKNRAEDWERKLEVATADLKHVQEKAKQAGLEDA